MNENEFPKLVNGSCDGLGCGVGVCFCDESLFMREEYQRKYKLPWTPWYDKKEGWEIRKAWEEGWALGHARFDKLFETVHQVVRERNGGIAAHTFRCDFFNAHEKLKNNG